MGLCRWSSRGSNLKIGGWRDGRSLVVGLLLTITLLSGCAKEAAAPEETAPPAKEESGFTLEKDRAKESGIETVLARIAPIQADLKVAGTVTSTANGRALVTPPVSGKILKLFVGPGDNVRQGQPLAIIESPDLVIADSALSEAERGRTSAGGDVQKVISELNLARAHARSAGNQLERQRSLAKAGAFSQPSLQAAQAALNQAEAELASAKADKAVHEVQLERAERLFAQELIARTELEQARLAVSQDQVRVQKSESEVRQGSNTLKREQEIAAKGLLTAKEVQAAEAEARSARLEVEQARIGLESAQRALQSTGKAVDNARANSSAVRGKGNGGAGNTATLTAPISGTVTERKATIGQVVERSTELFEIENLDTVWVTANVPEKDILLIEKGLKVQISAAAYPARTFTGVVQLLGNHLDAKTRTIPVQCLVQNPGGLLREDMFANAVISVGRSTQSLVVPDSAIDQHGEDVCVFVATGDKYETRKVKIGRSAGGFTEVLSGLKEGERVVSKGMFIVESESRRDELKGED